MSVFFNNQNQLNDLTHECSEFKKKKPFNLQINTEWKGTNQVLKEPLKFPKATLENFAATLISAAADLNDPTQDGIKIVKHIANQILTLPEEIYQENIYHDLGISKELAHILTTCKKRHLEGYYVDTLAIAQAFFANKNPIHMSENAFLGNGGFSLVHRVHLLNNEYARKTQTSPTSTMIARERNTLITLDHPNILKLVFQYQNSLYLELAEHSLEGKTKKHRLTAEEFSRIFSQTSNALAYMHQQGYIHGDIKADNILLKQGHVKISDFGTSVKTTEFSYERHQQIETSVYSPPEHLRKELPPYTEECKKIDVWAFGLLLWNQLKDERYQTPFTTVTNPHGIYKTVEDFESSATLTYAQDGPLNILEQLAPDKQAYYDPNGTITELICKCLELDWQKRPSMDEVSSILSSAPLNLY